MWETILLLAKLMAISALSRPILKEFKNYIPTNAEKYSRYLEIWNNKSKSKVHKKLIKNGQKLTKYTCREIEEAVRTDISTKPVNEVVEFCRDWESSFGKLFTEKK